MSVFPTVTHQLPYTLKLSAVTLKTAGAGGVPYTYYHDASTLRTWELQFGVLTAAEVTTLRNFFNTMGGAWDVFTFTDPDSASEYPTCRFDGDFELTYNSDDTYSLKLTVQETN